LRLSRFPSSLALVTALPRDSSPYAISIIVPCLNEEKVIEQTLARLLETPEDVEIIVVDGGSTDGTLRRLVRPRVKLLQTTRGRGHQLDFGARAARGTVLWFLHADTLITPESEQALRSALRDPAILSGNFSLVFGGRRRAARLMTWIYRHLRLIGLCYGDSGFFVRAQIYRQVGGFKDYPIFEDLDLLRRLCRAGKFVRLPANITTSSRRFEGGRSFAWTFAHWTFLQILFWLGFDPRRMGRLYRAVR
jgi:rSAM/selenodomain-associated transferase 2